MLVGYNTNISYRDKVYHIQTEDNGRSNPVIVTLLYSKGAILASKKTSYSHIAGDPDSDEAIRKLMKEQHKGMIKDLLSGRCTAERREEVPVEEEHFEETVATAVAEAPVEASLQERPSPQANPEREAVTKSLDDILLNYIMKRAKQ